MRFVLIRYHPNLKPHRQAKQEARKWKGTYRLPSCPGHVPHCHTPLVCRPDHLVPGSHHAEALVEARVKPRRTSMSAFAALQGFEGESDGDIVKSQKVRQKKEEQQREAAVAASQRSFADLKANIGSSNWGESEDEDEFLDLPVRACTSA